MPEQPKEKTGRTWADLAIALPPYLIAFLLVIVLGMIARAEFSSGITKFGVLGEWGKVQAAPPTADDAIIGANIRLNRQLECANLLISNIPERLSEWKEYMDTTAETYSNHSLRQSRTANWKSDVDNVIREMNILKQYLDGSRNSC
ncbi:hypothetical protein AB1P65_07115 [Roseibium alexandrii]